MESVGRVTRSKARTLGATPTTPIPTKSELKTTGRRRKGAAQIEEQQVEETPKKQLQFSQEPPAEEHAPTDQQLAATVNDEEEPLHVQFPSDSVASPGPKPLGDGNLHIETHDGPSAHLKASTTSLKSKEHRLTVANLEAVPVELGHLGSVADDGEVPQQVVGNPVFHVGISQMMSPSLIDTSSRGIATDASLISSFTSPQQVDQSLLSGAMSPKPVDPGLFSFQPDVGRLGAITESLDQTSAPSGAVKVGTQATRTPLGFNPKVPHDSALAIPQPPNVGVPASPLSLTAEVIDAAVFSPMPEDDFLDSPISLSGAQFEDFEHTQHGDEMMADDTPLALGAPSDVFTFASGPPERVLGASAALDPANLGFHGFAAVATTPVGLELETSPSLAGLMSASEASPSKFLMSDGATAANGATASPSSKALTTGSVSVDPYVVTALSSTVTFPMVGISLPLAPAPMPESGAIPSWRLEQKPLVNTLSEPLTDVANDQCKAVNQAFNNDSEVDAGNPAQGCSHMEMDNELSSQATVLLSAPTVSLVATGIHAKEAVIQALHLQGSSPTASDAFQNPLTHGPAKMGHNAATPAARSSLVSVESKYKTPTIGATAARPRPSIATAAGKSGALAPVGSANGAKSVKRVSIHTPDGLRCAVPNRHVVPTPFRPKLISKLREPIVVDEALADQSSSAVVETQNQSLNSQTSNPAVDCHDKATERMEHASIDAPAASFAAHLHSPGYIMPTQCFAVKASAKATVDAGGYDPRSLRQLRRGVKEAASRRAAKAALIEARAAKLTPKIPDQQLHMPDDDERSDDQAEYNEGQENELVAAMSGLEVAPPKNSVPMPLRGLPAPQGRHIRFNETGNVSESPQRTVLRGLPVATGKYIRFD